MERAREEQAMQQILEGAVFSLNLTSKFAASVSDSEQDLCLRVCLPIICQNL